MTHWPGFDLHFVSAGLADGGGGDGVEFVTGLAGRSASTTGSLHTARGPVIRLPEHRRVVLVEIACAAVRPCSQVRV